MKDSVHKYFKIGTLQWMSYPTSRYDFLESIKKLACDDYFDAIEIAGLADGEIRAKVKKMFTESHLNIKYGAHPVLLGLGLNPNDLDEAKRKAAEKALLEAVDQGADLGADGISFLSGRWNQEGKECAYGQLLKTTRAVCDYAGSKGMDVELEVFDFDVDKKSLIGPAPDAAEFAADMRKTHTNFGLIIDLSHIPLIHETSRFTIQTLRPYITHLHIGNAVTAPGCEAYGDNHPRFGYPNSINDVEELREFLSLLKEEGFFREKDPVVLSFEVKPWDDEDADIVLANCKRVLNRAWALVED